MSTLASTPVTSASVKRARRISRPLQYLALVLYMIFLGFPLLFLLTTAFKTSRELQSPTLATAWPAELTLICRPPGLPRRSESYVISRPSSPIVSFGE